MDKNSFLKARPYWQVFIRLRSFFGEGLDKKLIEMRVLISCGLVEINESHVVRIGRVIRNAVNVLREISSKELRELMVHVVASSLFPHEEQRGDLNRVRASHVSTLLGSEIETAECVADAAVVPRSADATDVMKLLLVDFGTRNSPSTICMLHQIAKLNCARMRIVIPVPAVPRLLVINDPGIGLVQTDRLPRRSELFNAVLRVHLAAFGVGELPRNELLQNIPSDWGIRVSRRQ